jgi:hypothetical protein
LGEGNDRKNEEETEADRGGMRRPGNPMQNHERPHYNGTGTNRKLILSKGSGKMYRGIQNNTRTK